MLSRIVQAIVYAAVRAYFDAVRDAKLAHEELATPVDHSRGDRFRDAVNRLRESNADASHSQPVNPPPGSGGFYGDYLPTDTIGGDDHATSDATTRVVDRGPVGGGGIA
jgi:hypothetical protein